MKHYDALIIGAGHAGVEAAHIMDKLGNKVALISFSKNDISSLPCNVSIGGSAKGIVVKEIFALGGLMPLAADETQLQTKILNNSKGDAVRALRAQVDKIKYPEFIKNFIENKTNIDIIEDEVLSLILEKETVVGVKLKKNNSITAKTIIITTGTFLNSKTMLGKELKISGPDFKQTSIKLADQIKNLGIETIRLKTGTPPRLNKNSIDWDKTIIEPGSEEPIYFTEDIKINKHFQNIPAYLTYTNIETHKIIENNFSNSYLFSDSKGVGPRYCPSIEDKVKRFYEKDRHQIFIELESEHSEVAYLSGLSSSLPRDVQEQFIKSIPAFKNSVFEKHGYAIEYDSIDPKFLKNTLESKKIKNLFFAGQVNGTSGYEEAASQGLIAGINASNLVNNKPPFELLRSEAYIGVMIDDITTKGVNEPYRLLTSRAEYRLILRTDNAVERLYEKAFTNDLISYERFEKIKNRLENQNQIKLDLSKARLKQENKLFSNLLNIKGIELKSNSVPAIDILKRPEFNLFEILPMLIEQIPKIEKLSVLELAKLNIEIKFEGYINKQQREINKYKRLLNLKFKENINFNDVENIAIEAKEKLNKYKPENIHQASKISGINPSDIMCLINFINKK